jgi:hypothetical protein
VNGVDSDAEEEEGLLKAKAMKEVKRRRRYVPAKNRCGPRTPGQRCGRPDHRMSELIRSLVKCTLSQSFLTLS